MLEAIGKRHVCDKTAAKRVLAAIAHGDIASAEAAMGDKLVLTL